jgi:rhodanese-related sulfurtransferase
VLLLLLLLLLLLPCQVRCHPPASLAPAAFRIVLLILSVVAVLVFLRIAPHFVSAAAAVPCHGPRRAAAAAAVVVDRGATKPVCA